MLGKIVNKRIVPVYYNCMGQVCMHDGFMSELDENMYLNDVCFWIIWIMDYVSWVVCFWIMCFWIMCFWIMCFCIMCFWVQCFWTKSVSMQCICLHTGFIFRHTRLLQQKLRMSMHSQTQIVTSSTPPLQNYAESSSNANALEYLNIAVRAAKAGDEPFAHEPTSLRTTRIISSPCQHAPRAGFM
jgi:hypothetical protein